MRIQNSLFHQSLLIKSLQGRKEWGILGLMLFFILWGNEVKAQVQVYSEQQLSFGSFVVGNSGGTITISHEGERIVTGDIIPIHQYEQVFPMILGIEAPLGAVVHIQNGPDVLLTGEHGGEMVLSMGESSHGFSFVSAVAPPERTYVSFTSTLTVESKVKAPSGNYSGTASIITFIQE